MTMHNDSPMAIAVLNSFGRDKFGVIFPEFRVPLRTIETQQMNIGGITDHFYFADYNRFSLDQKRLIKKFMNDQRDIPRDKVDQCIEAMHYQIPLSTKYVGFTYEIGGLRFA